MRRAKTPLDELTHAVQYRNRNTRYDVGWHTIAAFDVSVVAEKYAHDCGKEMGDMFEYRAIEIKRGKNVRT